MSGGELVGADYLFDEQKATGASGRAAFPSCRCRILKAADASASAHRRFRFPPTIFSCQLSVKRKHKFEFLIQFFILSKDLQLILNQIF